MSEEHRSLVEMLRHRASISPAVTAYTFLADGEIESDAITYGALDQRARAVAAVIAEQGVRPGDRAILLYPPGLDFIAGFFGSLYAGVVAVPCYPPHPSQLARALPRLLAVIDDADPAVVLCTAEIAALAPAIVRHAPRLSALAWIGTDVAEVAAADRWTEPPVNRDSLAFLQYTSGSTSAPRGVMVSHGNLLHNLAYANYVEENDDASRSISWLPVIHDMGLIEGVLQPVFAGYPAYLMAPTAFLQRPIRWLRAISRYRLTNSGGPNFAYDLCARKITAEQKASLDLSSWRVAYNGAEPIRRDTLVTFHNAFAECGFRWRAFYPVYGLAEGTLVVSSGRQSYEPVVHDLDSAALAEGRLSPACTVDAPVTSLVSSGPPSCGTDVVIVDPDHRVPRGPNQVGEIWVASPSVAHGYWRRDIETRDTFHAVLPGSDRRYLRTGDLGALIDSELVVVGRIKDMLIVRGMKYAPQDIELTVERQHDAIRLGCTAAFAVADAGEERIVVAAEIDVRRLGMCRDARDPSPHADVLSTELTAQLRDIATTIHRSVFDDHSIQLRAIALLPPGGIAKTSSGKIRRHACAAAFTSGEVTELYRWTHTLPPAPAGRPVLAEVHA